MREAVPSAEAEHIMHSAARKVFLSAENKCKKNPVEKMEMYDVFWNCQRKKKGMFFKGTDEVSFVSTSALLFKN